MKLVKIKMSVPRVLGLEGEDKMVECVLRISETTENFLKLKNLDGVTWEFVAEPGVPGDPESQDLSEIQKIYSFLKEQGFSGHSLTENLNLLYKLFSYGTSDLEDPRFHSPFLLASFQRALQEKVSPKIELPAELIRKALVQSEKDLSVFLVSIELACHSMGGGQYEFTDFLEKVYEGV